MNAQETLKAAVDATGGKEHVCVSYELSYYPHSGKEETCCSIFSSNHEGLATLTTDYQTFEQALHEFFAQRGIKGEAVQEPPEA